MVVGAEQIGVVGICQDTGTSAGEVEFATLLGSFCASGWNRVGPPGLTTESLERALSAFVQTHSKKQYRPTTRKVRPATFRKVEQIP